MQTPQNIPPLPLQDYWYELPVERIAEHPLAERDRSKLLVYNIPSAQLQHQSFEDLPTLLPAGSLLVVNHTRVIAARLHMLKPTGGVVEVLLTDPVRPLRDPAAVLASHDRSVWRCLIGGKNVHPGLVLHEPTANLVATVIERNGAEAHLELSWERDVSLSQVVSEVGTLPLPPYIHRDATAEDAVRYQTVYAVHEGSVAAPTAGLHFTSTTFSELALKNIDRVDVTLHVGLGTFRPVEALDAREHVMHEERYGVTSESIKSMLLHASSAQPWTTVVGTTSLRTLESLFAFGARLCRDGIHAHSSANVMQWEAFDQSLSNYTRIEVLAAIQSWMELVQVKEVWGDTRIMLAPGCRIAMADALITNFHQPGNTLLLLVAAFCGGDEWKNVYAAALNGDYRFLSYGDSSLLIR